MRSDFWREKICTKRRGTKRRGTKRRGTKRRGTKRRGTKHSGGSNVDEDHGKIKDSGSSFG
jgi:hypothetical protein